MAAHDANDERLLPKEVVTEEDKAHFIENFPADREVTPNQLREWHEIRTAGIRWTERATTQHLAEFKRYKSEYPILHDTTFDNYHAKQAEIGQSVPEKVWQALQNAEHLQARKQALVLKQPPRLRMMDRIEEASHKEEQQMPISHTYEYLDHDPRYHQLITDKVTAWNKAHPDRKITSAPLQQRPDGSVIISAEVLARMPAIETEAKERFAKEYEADYARYAVNERKRIYKNKDGQAAPQNDPAYMRLQKEIEDQANAGMEKQQQEQADYEAEIKEKTDEEIAKREEFNKKRHLSAIKYSAKNTDRESVEQEVRARFRGPNLLTKEELETKARHERLIQFAKDHPEKAAAYAQHDPFLKDALRELTEEEIAVNAKKRAAAIAKTITISQTSLPQYETEIVTEEVAAPIIATEHISVSGPTALGSADHSPTVSMEPGGAPPPVQGGNGQPRRGSPLGGAGNLLKNAANLIPQVRAFNTVKKYIPYIIILIAAFFLAILSFLANIMAGGGGGSSSSQNGQEIPVNITKTGPDQVANGAPIPYSIQVSYDGTASDIVVSDPIPTNATFVSATGNYLCDGKPPTANPTCKTVTWNASQQGASPSGTTSPSSSTKIDVTKYTKPPYDLPTPQDNASDVTYTPTIMARLNTIGSIVNQYQSYLLSQYSVADVDPFLTVIWNGAIEGIDGNQFFYNCLEGSYSLNQGCPTIASGDFQVGAGMQVGQAADHAVADFNAVYGSGKADDAAFVQQIGQAVITASNGKITYPAAFPKESLTQLLSEIASNKDSRQAFAILLMDDKFGAVSMASEVAKTINNNWAQTMCGWGSYYCDNLQKFSNRMLAIAKLYTGAGGGGSATFPPMGFTLTVKPNSSDDYVINQASAQVIP